MMDDELQINIQTPVNADEFIATLGALHDCITQRAEYGFNTKFNKIFLQASVFVLLISIVIIVLYNFICLFI